MGSQNISIDAEFDKVSQLGDALLQQINAMREVAPVIWSPTAKAWIVTRHADLVEAYTGTMPLSNIRYKPPFSRFTPEEQKARFPETMRSIGHWPTFIDPPIHTRIRKLLMRAFGKKVVEDLRPFVRENIAKILDQAGAKRDVEFVNGVARAVTARSILRLLGMGDDHISSLERWSYVINTALGSVSPSVEVLLELEDTVIAMRTIFEEEITRRRSEPGEDFLSQMVMSRDGADALSNDEIVGVCITVLIAGHDTTMNSMGLATIALSRDALAREYLLNNPDKIANSVMEISRYISMSTMQHRVVSEDFEWHGQQLKKGHLVFLMISGANRDPRRIP